LWEQIFSRFELKKNVRRKRTTNDPNSPFSREGDGKRQRKIPTQWSMVLLFGGKWKVILFGGQWKVLLFGG
jgi:hypothetical protein